MSQGADAAAAEGSVAVHRQGAVLRLTLDRPSRRNALTQLMIATLVDALTAAASDDSLRAVHIVGAGDDFCAGADWVAVNDPGGPRPRAGDLVRRIPHAAHRVIELVAGIQLPVVCSVRGWAVGFGCNLALAADFTVAAADAVFWEPFVERGFSPDSGSTWLLARLVGLARARRMLLLGEKVGGRDAADWGLIHRAVGGAELDDAAEELVGRLAAGPTAALGLAKQALSFGQHATLSQSLTQELFNLELSCRTSDFKEGLEAFRQRRDPDFRGR
ncbi:enoyl-CoA hydratase/isomerase family protein [Mycobacterium avium subsp. paratuberculosis]|uniref:Enoyl-CoA hydratase n=3 Tax=Mycobacterium avium TaxID=1764 RepID=A0A3B6XAW3_MYCAV|nr:enoyl-CoA hydratase-related protein [Mycobacterium avium]ELP47302.1 enoyl-CoA hydratase/isomerase [Mycobacterium avium subsp. paratuberculosis S5]AGL36357.1 Enoyl-CoA hydratase [Mycobacterium avium subsp. paratuberculosis MAP4]AJK74809.1 enoyl-CoA hydratase [Mycobacterium avium subsp. paratuberculosis]ANH29072.1 enoyl-CoA hydratase [Mycobacterium avium subsp. paratuberculosis]APA75155.1 enoyl-CoA hydratase/isomerase family protein [Mycobacterium avium subsp. hominissuis]